MILISAEVNAPAAYVYINVCGHSKISGLCSSVSAIMMYAEIACREADMNTVISRNKTGNFEIKAKLNPITEFTLGCLIQTFVCLQKKYKGEIIIKELSSNGS